MSSVWIDLADTYVSLTLHLNCFFTNRSLICRVCFDNLWPKYVSKIFLITKNWCETFKVEIIRSETTIIWGKRWRIKVPSHKIRRQCELQISILFARRLQQLGWETKRSCEHKVVRNAVLVKWLTNKWNAKPLKWNVNRVCTGQLPSLGLEPGHDCSYILISCSLLTFATTADRLNIARLAVWFYWWIIWPQTWEWCTLYSWPWEYKKLNRFNFVMFLCF